MRVEEWKGVLGAESRYQVSNIGRLRKTPKINPFGLEFGGGIMSIHLNSFTGYFQSSLPIVPGNRETCFIHVMVAESFLGPRPAWAQCVNHKNGDKLDNRVNNLEWSTYSNNVQHAVDTGLLPIKKGKDHGMAKLTEEDVRGIREDYINGTLSSFEIGKKYGVSQSAALGIVRYNSWSHLDPDKREYYQQMADSRKSRNIAIASRKKNTFGVERKLTDENIKEIRRIWTENQPITKRKIASLFNVHESTIRDVLGGKRYKLII